MKVLEKTLLAQVAGGVSMLAGEGEYGDGWGGGGGGMFSFDSGGGGGGGGGFDSNGIGANSCVAAAAVPANGLFGLTMTETLGAGAGISALSVGIGSGIGASAAIEAAGGFGALGTMEAAAVGVAGAMVGGLVASTMAGVAIGTILYNSSETVQDGAQAVIGGIVDLSVKGAEVIGDWSDNIGHGMPRR